MEILGLIPYPLGVNKILDNNCTVQFVDLKIKLNQNENPIILKNIDAVSSGSYSTGIISINGTAWANPLNPTIFIPPGIEVTFRLYYDTNALTVGMNDIIQISLTWEDSITHATVGQVFPFEIEVIDTAAQVFTQDVNTVFLDCSNDCGAECVVATFTNPSAFDIPVYLTTVNTIPFTFNANGNPLLYDAGLLRYYFNLPGNGTVEIRAANPNCAITVDTDFVLSYEICSVIASNINVDHNIVNCDKCGISCYGLTVNTTNGSASFIDTTDPWYVNQTTGVHSWSFPNTSPTCSGWFNFINGNNLGLETNSCVSPYNIDLLGGVIDFSGYVNNGDPYEIEYSFTTGSEWTDTYPVVYFDDFCNTLGIQSYLVTGSVTPNTTYSGTCSGIFQYPGTVGLPAAPGAFQFRLGANTGDRLTIQSAYIRIRSVNAVNLINPQSLNCSDLSLYNKTAIGDYKSLTYHLNYGNGFQDNVRLWFNPWMYSDTGNFVNTYFNGFAAEPYTGYLIYVQSSWIGDGLFHPMTLVSNNANASRNFNARVEFITRHEFKVHFDFYITEDVNDWISNSGSDNHRRLLFSSSNEFNELTLSSQCVYNSQKQLAAYFYIFDQNIITGYNQNGFPIFYECFSEKRVFFSNRFWNLGLNGGQSEMTNPYFTFHRNGHWVSNLTIFGNTEARFSVGHSSNIDHVVFWLFDTNAYDNSINFYDNYDSSRAVIIDVPTNNAVIDNHFVGPSNAVFEINPGQGVYETIVNIGNNLRTSGVYRLGAICYDNTNNIVNSFISDPLSVATVPDIWDVCSTLDVDSRWQNYYNTYTQTTFSPTIKERIQNQITFGAGAFANTLTNLGMPSGYSWLSYIKQVQLNIYQKVDNYPPGQRTYFMFKQYVVDRNTSIPGNWDNHGSNEFSVFDTGSDIITNWFGRSLWDGSAFDPNKVYTGPLSEYLSRIPAGFANANTYIGANNINNDWSDKDIYFEYNLIFDLTSLIGTQYVLALTQLNLLHPIAEETNPLPFGSILTDIKIYGAKVGEAPVELQDQVCDNKYDYLIIQVFGTGVAWDNFIAMFEPYPYSNSSLYEENAGGGIFTQLDTIYIDNAYANFDGSDYAEYHVPLSQLGPGKYKFSGLRIVQ